VPTLRHLFEWVADNGYAISLDEGYHSIDVDSPDWTEAGIHYKEGRSPIVSDVSRDDGSPDCLIREEIGEFRDFLEDVDDSPARARVLHHLANTTFIIANQYPSDIDGEGYAVSGWFLNYLVMHHGGIVQCDGEGFYEGADLIVELS